MILRYLANSFFIFLHFLSSRKARIVLNGECGEWVSSESGTFAGTILGSILFIIYIHDAPKVAKKFADDVSGIAVANNVAEVQQGLQATASEIDALALKWGLEINFSKTKVMPFGNTPDIHIVIQGRIIENVKDHRILGIILDKNLKFYINGIRCRSPPYLRRVNA